MMNPYRLPANPKHPQSITWIEVLACVMARGLLLGFVIYVLASVLSQ